MKGITRLRKRIKVLMFQSVRELLFNVTKHAKTTCARIAMTHQDAEIKIAVSDAGTGFDPQNLLRSEMETDKGLGLFSVRERFMLFKGTI